MEGYLCKKVDLKGKILPVDEMKYPWNVAKKSLLLRTENGSSPTLATDFRMCYDEKNLYVHFVCQDDYKNAKLTEFNDLIFNEEVVEIFIDEFREGKIYHEFEVSPINTVLYYLIQNKGNRCLTSFARIENTIVSQVKNFDGGYNIMFSIPFDEFLNGTNLSGKKWLFNAYRIDRPKDGNDEYSALNPTGKIDFHMPEKFIELLFE